MSNDPNMQMLGERTHTGEDDTGGGAFFKDESIDTSPEVTPQTFDSGAFLAGVRPTRRSVQIVERADLVGDMERLAELYNQADEADDDEACDRLGAEFVRVSDTFHGSKRWYTVEKRSSDWVEKFRNDQAEKVGIELPEDGSMPREAMPIMLEQLAAQIVYPQGTTAKDLQGLFDRNEGELNKLMVAMQYANTQVATSAKVATPGFSLRRSEKKRTPGSTKR